MKNITVAVAAGGTGGHLYPGIALAEELSDRGVRSVFIVRKNDIGAAILDDKKIEYVSVAARPFPRGAPLMLPSFLAGNVRGAAEAFAVLRRLRPSVVAGMGAYVSFPTVSAAVFSGIPALIHEQNSVPGLANKILAPFVGRTALSFSDSARYFACARKLVTTGNPVRREITSAPRDPAKFGLAPDAAVVLVFGGSQGASSLNAAVVSALKHLEQIKKRLQFIHLTGDADYRGVKDAYSGDGWRAAVFPYLREMGAVYAAADLAVCRAGATTVAELAATGLPALLVPYPAASGDHQTKNASAHIAAGYPAEIIGEEVLGPALLASKIAAFISSARAKRAAPAGKTAAAALADEIMALA